MGEELLLPLLGIGAFFMLNSKKAPPSTGNQNNNNGGLGSQINNAINQGQTAINQGIQTATGIENAASGAVTTVDNLFGGGGSSNEDPGTGDPTTDPGSSTEDPSSDPSMDPNADPGSYGDPGYSGD